MNFHRPLADIETGLDTHDFMAVEALRDQPIAAVFDFETNAVASIQPFPAIQLTEYVDTDSSDGSEYTDSQPSDELYTMQNIVTASAQDTTVQPFPYPDAKETSGSSDGSSSVEEPRLPDEVIFAVARFKSDVYSCLNHILHHTLGGQRCNFGPFFRINGGFREDRTGTNATVLFRCNETFGNDARRLFFRVKFQTDLSIQKFIRFLQAVADKIDDMEHKENKQTYVLFQNWDTIQVEGPGMMITTYSVFLGEERNQEYVSPLDGGDAAIITKVFQLQRTGEETHINDP